MARITYINPGAKTAHMAGYEWVRPAYLSQVIDVQEATDVFRAWLLKAADHIPPDELAFAEQLISETCEKRHVLLMVDFIASAYQRILKERKAA